MKTSRLVSFLVAVAMLLELGGCDSSASPSAIRTIHTEKGVVVWSNADSLPNHQWRLQGNLTATLLPGYLLVEAKDGRKFVIPSNRVLYFADGDDPALWSKD